MNGRSLGMLMMAVVCGLGAMYGTTKLISRGKAVPVSAMQDVLVATRDFKVEEMIKSNLVKVARMPQTAIPFGAFSSSKDVEDRWVQIGILEGEPIIERKLAPRGLPPGLVARIPLGMRAFAIEVNEQTGVSGFVLPDHRVDVVEMETGNNGKPEANAVLQDVQVLASGQIFNHPDDRSLQSRTVTLAVTPDQVDSLVAAKSRGTLTLSLRGLNDHSQAALKKKVEPPPPPPPVAVVPAGPPKPVQSSVPPPLKEPKMLLVVEPQVEPDSLGRLTYDGPLTGLGVLVKPTDRVKSVTWQLDDSSSIPMTGNSRPNTAEDEAFWSSEAVSEGGENLWNPGPHLLTIRLETNEALPQTFMIHQVILVKPQPQFVVIYRGNSSSAKTEQIRYFRNRQEMAEAGDQSKADVQVDRKAFYDSLAKAAAESTARQGVPYERSPP